MTRKKFRLYKRLDSHRDFGYKDPNFEITPFQTCSQLMLQDFELYRNYIVEVMGPRNPNSEYLFRHRSLASLKSFFRRASGYGFFLDSDRQLLLIDVSFRQVMQKVWLMVMTVQRKQDKRELNYFVHVNYLKRVKQWQVQRNTYIAPTFFGSYDISIPQQLPLFPLREAIAQQKYRAYTKRLICTLLRGMILRNNQASSLYRAFSKHPLAECRLLRLIVDMA